MKRRRMCSLLFLFLFVFPLSSFGAAVTTYFPMSDGDNKLYTFTLGNSVRNMELTYRSYDLTWDIYLETDSTDNSKITYETSESTLTMWGTFLGGDYLRFNQPLVVASESQLQYGGRISSSTTAQFQGSDITISSETIILKVDKVVVPAGKYTNCRSVSFRVTIKIEGTNYPVVLDNVWTLAPHVGKIEIEVVDQYGNYIDTAELVSGRVSGQDVTEYADPEQDPMLMPGVQLLLSEKGILNE